MLKKLQKSFSVGLKRRWKSGLTRAFSVAGAIWLVTEIAIKVSKTADDWVVAHGDLYTATVLAAGLLWFLSHIYETRAVSFKVPTIDSRIDVKFGDLFEEETDWVVGVGEFFDSELGHIIARESLHGQVIEKIWNGDCAKFRHDVDAALANCRSTVTKRTIEPKRRYPIGTTAVLRNGARKIFLVAIAQVDMDSAKATSSVPLLWDALRGALESIHHFGNGATVTFPLIGNGRSAVNIEPQHLLRLIVLALIDYGRKEGLPKQVNIVVPEVCFRLLDIREIRRDWASN